MEIWNIRLLGVCGALRGIEQAHLRSQETWAVLASLLLPSVLRHELPGFLARETLGDRFWRESRRDLDPRTSLRQCLGSLRSAFGEACLVINRQAVRLASGWCVSDLERAFAAYRNSLAAASQEERLEWLLAAEQEIRGEFLESWTPDTEEAQAWLIGARADVRNALILPVFLGLAETLETLGDTTGAFDAIRHALAFQPGHVQARKRAWPLAVASGQQDVMQALEKVSSFRDAVRQSPHMGLRERPLKEARLMQALFEAELTTLSPPLRRALLKLAVFPASFSEEIAAAVCDVPLSVLEDLAETSFLQRTPGTFLLTRLVHDCAWRHLTAATRRRLRTRLAQFCLETLITADLSHQVLPKPFLPVERGRPLLQFALEWVLEQPPTLNHVQLINLMRYFGLNDLALQGISYLRQTAADPLLASPLRFEAGVSAAYSLMQADDNAGAILLLIDALVLAESVAMPGWQAIAHATLMRAYSNIGAWSEARQWGAKAAEYSRHYEDFSKQSYAVRFLAEIEYYAGAPEQALRLCTEAQELAQYLPAESDNIPDTLYWRARILCALQRWEEASEAIERALFLWQEAGDTKKGLCLCVLGQIHTQTVRYGEARMHLEHSIDLQWRVGREWHRVAAVEALGDLFYATRRPEEAQARYQECFAYYRQQGYLPAQERLQQKLNFAEREAAPSSSTPR